MDTAGSLYMVVDSIRASLTAQLVNNQPAMQGTLVNSWVRKTHWRRDRLPIPVFVGFPGGSAGKESACNARDLGSTRVRPLEKGKATHSSYFWPGELHGLYIVHGVAESDTTEQLSLTHRLNKPHFKGNGIQFTYRLYLNTDEIKNKQRQGKSR